MNRVGFFTKGKGSFGGINMPVQRTDIFLFDTGGVNTSGGSSTTETLQNGIVSGNGVAWITDMDYEVTPYVFNIGNKQYSTNRRLVTLEDADLTYDRIDLIVATYDSQGNGTIEVVTGTPAASPIKPTVTASQLEITNILVRQAVLGVPVTVVYDENTEFTVSHNTTNRVNADDTTNVFNDTKAIKVTSFQAGDEIVFTGGVFNPTTFNVLQLMISSVAKWQDNGEIEVAIYNGIQQVSAWVKIDGDPYNSKRNDVFFESGNTSWQAVVIPIEKFNVTSTVATKVVIRKVSLGIDTFSLDLIRLQGGLPVPITISGKSVFIVDGNFLVFKAPGNKNEFALEIGDLLTGMWSADNEFWQLARYNGGDVDVKGSYTVFAPIELS